MKNYSDQKFIRVKTLFATIFMAWILMGLPHMAEAAIEVSRGADGSDRVSGELINVDWQADDTVILSWKKSGKSFLELGPKRIFGSTRRGETGSWKR